MRYFILKKTVGGFNGGVNGRLFHDLLGGFSEDFGRILGGFWEDCLGLRGVVLGMFGDFRGVCFGIVFGFPMNSKLIPYEFLMCKYL